MSEIQRAKITVEELFDLLNTGLKDITVEGDPEIKIRDIKDIKRKIDPNATGPNWYIEWFGISSNIDLERSDIHNYVKAVMSQISWHQDTYDVEW
jgi:hypothetical protein